MNRALLCALSLGIDAALGDPACVPHPVVLMGRTVEQLETLLRRSPEAATPERELVAGGVMAVGVVGVTFAASRIALRCASRVHPGARAALELWWGWQCLAMRGLADEARNVERTLCTGTLEEARAAVGRIVGRDTCRLDKAGVTRAAIESVAESFSDGVVAPMLYLAAGGAPLALAYKAVNTMDSMVGYTNDRYLYFGRVAARLDDACNLVPSRISALLLVASAALCTEDWRGAWRIWQRDRRRHASPNSAQTESAMAGALGLQLAGPAWYFGTYHDKPTIGDGTRKPQPADIGRATRMMLVGSVLCLALCCTASCARVLAGAVLRRGGTGLRALAPATGRIP